MRILITGGAGFVGANLGVSLAARHPNWEVVALDNLMRRGSELNLSRLRDAGILIGRSPESALVLDDDFASGRHARIYKGSDGWVVEDLGSTNGTFNGPMRLTVATPVTAGTEIRFGTTVVELRR